MVPRRCATAAKSQRGQTMELYYTLVQVSDTYAQYVGAKRCAWFTLLQVPEGE